MTTPSSLIVSNSTQTIQLRDNLGRSITVRRINAIDRLRLLKAAGPELSQNDAWLNMAALTLAVVEIDGIPRPVPTNERQIEALVAELGDEGLRSVADAISDNEEAQSLFEGSPAGNVVGTQT